MTAVSDHIGVLIAGRAIQGVSAAAIPLGISLLSVIMPRERVGSSIALISAMLGVGGALGLPFAGFVAGHYDFHTLFWVNAVVAAAAFVGILMIVPEAPGRSGGRVDLVGSVLLAGALITLLLPLTQSAKWGWDDPRVWVLLGLSVRPHPGLRLDADPDHGSAGRPQGPVATGRSSSPTSPRSPSGSRCSRRSSAPRRTSRRPSPAATGSAPACSSAASCCCPAVSRCSSSRRSPRS